MKISSILCPTDFSEPSRHAMEHAVTIAQWYGAQVIPLHVQAPALATVPALMGGGGPEPAYAPGTQIVYGGSAADAIAGFAVASSVDLIVMGTHGVGGFRHLILGSVTETVLRQVDCPVLTVPPRAESTSRLPFKRVLCAVDFSAPSLAALRLACEFAEESDASLDVLHAIDEPGEHELFVPRPYDIHHHRELYEQHVVEHLERVLPTDVRARIDVRLRSELGKPDERILRAAERSIDMIVMGVGRSADVAFGSTVNAVVRNARCPVLTVRR